MHHCCSSDSHAGTCVRARSPDESSRAVSCGMAQFIAPREAAQQSKAHQRRPSNLDRMIFSVLFYGRTLGAIHEWGSWLVLTTDLEPASIRGVYYMKFCVKICMLACLLFVIGRSTSASAQVLT